jgi:UDP-N-acetylmuramate--alanine ligase
MKKIKSIHFVGIKGVGMTALALLAKEAGIMVTGSDVADTFITDEPLKKAGIKVYSEFLAQHVDGIDFVITTGAHGGFTNPEVIAARNNKTPVITQGQAVGEFMKGQLLGKRFSGISVLGTHGKTTTTAMIATIFEKSGLNPSYVVGTSVIPSLKNAGHFGRGKYFIAEADEYATEPVYDKTPKFMWQNPDIAVITNLDHDHVDIYPTLDDVKQAFTEFIKKLSDKTLVYLGDNSTIVDVVKQFNGTKITYGFSPKNTYVIKNIRVSQDHTFFWLETAETSLGEFMINVAGEHNALNATAAIAVALECNIPLETIKQSLRTFSGSKRRLEIKGTTKKGALVIDDYAHHPTEIKTTLAALKKMYPKKKIVCVFQPHTYSRTKVLFEDFLSSFVDADTVLLTSIYASAREQKDESVSSEILARQMSQKHRNVMFLASISNVIEYIDQKEYASDSVIVTMGAGDIYKVGEAICKQK